jgi:hypothetical protein
MLAASAGHLHSDEGRDSDPHRNSLRHDDSDYQVRDENTCRGVYCQGDDRTEGSVHRYLHSPGYGDDIICHIYDSDPPVSRLINVILCLLYDDVFNFVLRISYHSFFVIYAARPLLYKPVLDVFYSLPEGHFVFHDVLRDPDFVLSLVRVSIICDVLRDIY